MTKLSTARYVATCFLCNEPPTGRQIVQSGLCNVDCFRVSLSPGNFKVIATKVSNFTTLGSHTPTSHARRLAATLRNTMRRTLRLPALRGAADMGHRIGETVRRIPAPEFPKILNVASVLVTAKQGPDGPQQVVVIGAQNSRPSWTQAPR